MRAWKVALRPENEATRRSGPRRVTTNYVNIGNAENSTDSLRLQFLSNKIGLNRAHAIIVAALLWGSPWTM